MPMDRAKYPPDWEGISIRVRDRARGQCECTGECGLHAGRRCEERHGDFAKWAKGKIVLTVAHLDHNPESADETRLKATLDRKRGQQRLVP